MSREWKPGDVAFVNGRVCMRVDDMWEHGDPRAFRYADHQALNVRPVVVIDPESEADVQRFADCVNKVSDGTPVGYRLQAALREFANPQPPKPDEPTGLGAVVEDADGSRWIRHEHDPGRRDQRHAWYPAGYARGARVTWDDIDAVKVVRP